MVTIQDGDQHYNNAAAAATTTVTVNPDQDDDDAPLISFLCRALYDYDAQDASALSFRQGDLIEVLSQQPSGWWDGLLGEERGWFPSNYVTIITDEEVDQALSGSELSGAESSTAGPRTEDPTVDMTHALMRGSQSENEEWLDRELQAQRRPATSTAPSSSIGDASRSRSNTGQSAAVVAKAQPPEDFWVPEVTADHQIWFVNERTGERARDIPRESEDEASDGDLAGFTSQSSSRSTTSVNMPFTLNGATDPASGAHSRSTTDVPTSRTTPEPWVKKLWNDGTSYYYYNTVDGTSQWTRPHARNGSSSNPNGANLFVEPTSRPGDNKRLSVYSDSSDVQPLDYVQNGQPSRRGKARDKPAAPSVDPAILELTSAEKIAKSLQQALEPPPPEVVADLTSLARSAIQAVVDNVQAGSALRKADEFAYLDDLVSHVVVAVRNLLYVVAIPTGHIPSSVLPRGERDTLHRSQSSQSSPLRGAQRKVTATLSRLVLSARAMQYDSGSQLADTLNRIESDAEELERAILFFVSEVQRIQPVSDPNNPDLKAKRLQGVLSNSNIGLGLVGAGAAASWKGLGWVSLENESASPKKTLDATVVADIGGQLSQLQDTIAGLSHALRIVNDSSVEQVRQRVQQTVTQLSAFLTLTADINIARHVDIDGIRQGEVGANDQYSQSVDNARRLVRTLETVLQALYDDTAALLLTTQNIRDSNDGSQIPGDRESSYDLLDKLSTSLSSNLSQCRQAIEAILSVGREQAELAAGDYRGSIEWRMSRLSVIHGQFANGAIVANGANHAAKGDDAYDSENEGVVDLGFAFNRPGGRKKSVTQDSSYESGATFANGVGGTSSSSLNPTDTEDLDSTLVSHELHDDGDFFDDDLPKPPVRSKKDKNLEKWLGDEYADKVAADSRPWYLRPNYNPSDIIIEADGSVRGGTVTALVERLTAHEHLADRTFTEAFLMTFKSFTTVEELTDFLIQRFRIQPPDGLAPAELDEWSRLKQKVIQIRVMNTFKSVVTLDDIIEKEDMYVLDKIDAFVSSEDASAFPAAKQIKKLIEQRIIEGSNLKSLINTTLSPPPPPIVPKNIKKLRLTDIEPLELARQLTIMESQLYQRIRPMECLQRAREQKTENMDNIAVVIQTSNKIADWVADLVLSKDDSKRRAAVVKHLISVADRCRTLNNFSSMIAITSGLNTPPIRRLKRTWEQVGQRYMAQFGACEMTIDSNKNFTKYRQLMASVTPPCVPFIGVFLSTLQFIQDGNPDNLPGGLVNFRKRQKASEVISDIKRWQTQSFNLQILPVVFNFIEESLNQFSDTKASSDIFWQLSLEREPREREDEKMARLLQESGFL
ncbi:hypothetical protein EST38_g4250 [Candolleomyces aberdarensis]|uniref:Ras GEF n=1 Tax=Candolleomyces aberdarensis TaxID=2316362 RepID=A0A4V1Q4C5_9AGAR|nr:hypothetical protein EST38_g4250 [Candolleomyces aberdarensis]